MTTFLAVLTGGGLAAIGGLLSGLLTNWLSDKRDQRKYEHERAMALDARRQDRLEKAYLELLGFLAHKARWALSVRPNLGSVEAPDPFLEDVQVGTLVEAYGSLEVRELLSNWNDYATSLANVADGRADIAMEEKWLRRSPQLEKWVRSSPELDDEAKRELAIEAYRDEMFRVEEAIQDKVRRELAGEA